MTFSTQTRGMIVMMLGRFFSRSLVLFFAVCSTPEQRSENFSASRYDVVLPYMLTLEKYAVPYNN